MKSRWRRGTILLQTLVMSVVLCMISVMMMKWILARYMMAARNYRSTVAEGHTQIYAGDQMSRWNFVNYPNPASIPSGGSYTIPGDNKTVSYSRTGGTSMAVTITTDEDQP